MLENRFEKQMQQKMKEFGFKPSSGVWEDVEKRIRKRRKRRIIFWLFLFLLLSGSSITTGILMTRDKKINTEQSYLNTKKPESPGLSAANPLRNAKPVAGNQSAKHNPEKFSNKESITTNSNPLIVDNRMAIINKKRAEKNIRKTPTGKKESNSVISELQKPGDRKQIVDSSVAVDQSRSGNTDELNEKEKSYDQHSTSEEMKNDIVLKNIVQEFKDSANTQHPAANKQPVSEVTMKKWKLGLSIEGGIAQTAKGIGFISRNSSSAYQVPSANNGGSAVNPTAVHSSGAFSAGVFVQRSLSKKLVLDLGLHYLFLSTRMKVGSKIDSTPFNSSLASNTNSFYRGTNADNPYINQYHFLNLSASLAWSISGRNLIYWKNGISYSRLLYSDELYFDRTNFIYYRDFSLLNKNHFFLSTGFSVPAGNRFDLDAFLKYDLIPGSSNKNLPTTHFSYYGIGIKYFLSGKK